MATPEMLTNVARLYLALFGRAPDGAGLAFWFDQLAAGKTVTQVADAMFATAPARAYYPDGASQQAIVTSFYVNTLGRQPDAGGMAFWTQKLQQPGATPGGVITEMIWNVANYAGADANGLKSAALFGNMTQVAQYYGEKNGSVATATTAAHLVTTDPATVALIKSQMDQDSVSGVRQLRNPFTTGTDVLVGNPAGDTYDGTASTVQATDSVIGGAGSDTIYITGTATVPQTQSIEAMEYTAPGGPLDLRSVAGLQRLTVKQQPNADITVGAVTDMVLTGLSGAANVVHHPAAVNLAVTLGWSWAGWGAAFTAGSGLTIDHTAGADGASRVTLKLGPLARYWLAVDGAPLAQAGGNVVLTPHALQPGTVLEPGTNFRVETTGATTQFLVDIDGSGSFDAAKDARITVIGQHAASSVVFDAASQSIVLTY